jgi:hypothetical protein
MTGRKNDPHVADTGKKRRYAVVFGAAVCAILVGASLIWLFGELRSVLDHISPGRSLAPSSSMAPHEISLKLAEENGTVNEWKLAVPRAFVVDETGENGAVAPWTGSNTGYFSTSIVLLQADDGKFVPETSVTERHRYSKMKRIVIFLGNTDTDTWIFKNDVCVPQHLLGDAARQYGVKDRNSPCLDRDNACYIIGAHADGWAVGIAATKDLYANPQQVCATVKTFLNTYTVRRDTIKPRS